MSKPFKSQFDLMAEAYGDIKYNKQAIINEYSSTRKVRGYEPQVIGESHKHGAVEEHYPEEEDPKQPLEPEDAEGAETVGFEELGLNRAVADSLNADGGGESFYRAVNPNLDIGSLKKLIANREARMKLPGMRDIGMSGQLTRMLKQISGLDDAVVVSFSEDGENAEDAEEAGFNHKQLDELEDIVHAILDKRDHEDRASKHEDGEY